jgi:hypothetical protein
VYFLTSTNYYNAAAYNLRNNQRYATQYYTLEASRISTLASASPSTCTGYLHSVNLMPIWKYVLIYALYAKRPCFVSRTWTAYSLQLWYPVILHNPQSFTLLPLTRYFSTEKWRQQAHLKRLYLTYQTTCHYILILTHTTLKFVYKVTTLTHWTS